MIQNYSRWKVLKPFFDDPVPREGFTVRWISRKINLAPTSVKLHLNDLAAEGKEGYPLVIKSSGLNFPVYRANRESELFRFLKKIDMLFRIEQSGLAEYLNDNLFPKSIILFGSASLGEDVSESDVDLFLECKEKRVDLSRFEEILNRKISLLFSGNINSVPKELRNNIINGIKISGYLKVF